MRGVWVDTGNDPVWEKIDKYGIRWLYFPLSDPPDDVQRRLRDTRQRGYVGGVYAAWNWYGSPSGRDFANLVDDALARVAPDATSTWPKVMLDDERHEPDTIEELFATWRAIPRRRFAPTAWTLESMQGGWMDAHFTQAVADARVRVVPQCYQGDDMAPVDTLAAARDLTARGIPDKSISPFYDASRLPIAWDGFAFTMGRLI